MTRIWDPSIKSTVAITSASLVLCCLTSQVFAGGFQLNEQSVTYLGTAYSGTAALAEDASTGFYNAAGLTMLNESEVVLSAIGINGDFRFVASSSNTSFPPATPAGNVGSSVHPGKTALVPAFHLSKRIDDRWVFGFGITSPFGLFDNYGEASIARYVATKTRLQTINFSPSLAYQAMCCLSFGVGFDAEYAKADLESSLGAGNTATDGFLKNHADGWGYGWHFGALWEISDATRLGINYRSHVNLRTEGTAELLIPNVPAAFGAAANQYTMQKVNANVTLPETATLSLYHAFNEQFAATADVAWTNWSRFHTLRLRYQPGSVALNGVGIDTDTWEHFKDARRYAIGLTYTYDPQWLFRIGTAYEETPTRDDRRTARIPDEDRIWLALGAAYNYSPCLRFDFGYAHLFFEHATINETAPFAAQTNVPINAAALAGRYKSNANILGIQVRYDFV